MELLRSMRKAGLSFCSIISGKMTGRIPGKKSGSIYSKLSGRKPGSIPGKIPGGKTA